MKRFFEVLLEASNDNADLSLIIGLGLACLAFALTGVFDAIIRS
jgi:hypothetical protein